MLNIDGSEPSTSVEERCDAEIDSKNISIASISTCFLNKNINSSTAATTVSKNNSNIFISCYSLPRFLNLVFVFLLLIPNHVTAVSARCYFFGPGMTITGSEYRRDYGLSQRECANVCKEDSCCMAFEYVDEECTLKTRSLNGTISPKQNSIFGLCLDFEDDDRDRFWDHELGGTVLEEKPFMHRDSCSDFCSAVEKAVIYSWRSSDSRNMDETSGHCKCIGVLHSIKVSFGSFAGFLL